MYLPGDDPTSEVTARNAVPAQRSLAQVSRMISGRKAIAALRASNLYINRNPFRSGGVCGRLDFSIGFFLVTLIAALGIVGGGFLKLMDGVHAHADEYGTLLLSVSLIFFALFSCALTLKRIRDIKGTSKNDMAISALTSLLLLIPVINLGTILYLCSVRGRVTHADNDGKHSTGRELNEQVRNSDQEIYVTTSGQLVGFMVLASAIVAVCIGAALIIPHTHDALSEYIHNSKLPRTGKFKARFALNKEGTSMMTAIQEELFDAVPFTAPQGTTLDKIGSGFRKRSAPGYKNINSENWKTHREIKKSNSIIDNVRSVYTSGGYQITNKVFDYCSPLHDTKRQLAFNKSGKVRFYSRSLGTLSSSITIDHYYDTSGTLRHLQAQIASLENGGGKSEYRVFFDEKGRRIWETKKQLAGKTTFPFQYWPAELTSTKTPAAGEFRNQNCSLVASKNP